MPYLMPLNNQSEIRILLETYRVAAPFEAAVFRVFLAGAAFFAASAKEPPIAAPQGLLCLMTAAAGSGHPRRHGSDAN